MSPSLIIMPLENLRPGHNLFLIELYACLSMGFVLYNVSDLMGYHFYRKTLKGSRKMKDVAVHFGIQKRVFENTSVSSFAAVLPHEEMNNYWKGPPSL